MLIKGGEIGLIRETQEVYFLMFCNRMATFFINAVAMWEPGAEAPLD